MTQGNTVKPSNIKKWDIIQHEHKDHSPVTKAIKNPSHYGYFQKEDGLWYPHRLPTIPEILNDEFK